MKKILYVWLLLLAMTSLAGCKGKDDTQGAEIRKYPVKVSEVKLENFPIAIECQGITGGSEVRKLSFKSTAKISKINVSKGQHVKKGDLLVELDKSDLTFAVNAAKSQIDSADAQYNKAVNGAQQEDINKAQIQVNNAQNNYNYCKDIYDKNLQLYNTGNIAKQQLDNLKLNLDNAESSLNGAKQSLQQLQNGSREEDKAALSSQVNTAKANYDSKANLLQDASMVSDEDGYVVDVLCKAGEIQAAGNPVVLLRSENQVITVGLSETDVKKVQPGSKAKVVIGDFSGEGEVVNIVQIADSQSGTFSSEIKLSQTIDNSKFYIGEIARVYINAGDKSSIWVPISSIQNDGEDYVYTVEDGHSVKKNITLGEAYDDKASVEGLKAGDKLVIEGMKNIKAGYGVSIK